MSASNWAVCPRCKLAERRKVELREEFARDQYGKITAEEWTALTAEVWREREAFNNLCAGVTGPDGETLTTFREDYEFLFAAGVGAPPGSYDEEDPESDATHVIAVYKGGCDVCHLRLEFRHEHELEVTP